MSLIKLNTGNTETVVSVSAVTKTQQANATVLFGKNATVLVKRLDELNKIKELDTAKIRAILDVLSDNEATAALAKKAAGKTLVTAVKNLYKAKTLVATINALRAIRIKVNATNELSAKAKTTKLGAVKPGADQTWAQKAQGKIVNNQHYVIDETRAGNDRIIKGPFRTENEALKHVYKPKGVSKGVVYQYVATGRECLAENLIWTQHPEMDFDAEADKLSKTTAGKQKRPDAKVPSAFKYTATQLLSMAQAQRVKTTAQLEKALGDLADLNYGVSNNGMDLDPAKKGDSWYIDGSYGNGAIYISFDDVDEGREFHNKWRVTAGLSSGDIDEKTFAVGDIAGIKAFLEKHK